jgi:peptidoglycan/LPS O-acetylase OafA/YrhL
MSTISVEVPVFDPAEQSRFRAPAVDRAGALASSDRNPTLDAARLSAALGLIWIHTTFSPFHILGRFGTSFFVLAAIFFMFHPLGSSPRPAYGTYVWKRFRRLYIPFAAWSLIYFIIREVKRLIFHEPLLDVGWGRFVAGTSMQFWFLPFILLACILCFPLAPIFERMGKKKLLLLPPIIAAGAWIALAPRPQLGIRDEVAKYFVNSAWTFAPSVFWALALAIVYPLLPARLRQSRWLAVLGLGLTASCIYYLWTIRQAVDPLPSLPRTLAGVGWLLVALVPLRSRVVLLVAPLGKYSYGIYLVHALFVASLHSVFKSFHITSTAWLDILVVAAAFTASAWLTVALRKHRWTSWLVP